MRTHRGDRLGVFMKPSFFLVAAVAMVMASGAGAAGLDLGDCDVLIGQGDRQAFDGYLAEQRNRATKGSLPARKVRCE